MTKFNYFFQPERVYRLLPNHIQKVIELIGKFMLHKIYPTLTNGMIYPTFCNNSRHQSSWLSVLFEHAYAFCITRRKTSPLYNGHLPEKNKPLPQIALQTTGEVNILAAEFNSFC